MFGNFVRDRQINVVVRILCASSCANYVFTGAKSVYLEAGAIVGWHGGALQDYSDQMKNFSEENKLMMRQSMADWCSEESAFFAAINKPQEMLIWGQLFSQQKNYSDEIQLWSYSLMDLKNLGFDVTAEDKEIAVTNEKVGHIAAVLPVTSKLLSFSRSCKEALELTFN
ncbi:hypothetical protein CA267_006640 [Alteromonas pelagimontana]|uniref:Uncharacterized protein n=1 Tax=Alteromonas pelagimontana TaxID=1858656 RepID=A0A6M4MBD9_9ALTE|nr:hypothetical protein [Alteromonas pelagimontana]QJR80473.1 hypothetical protein CA267_006640 [Alteromonas pelagimontana]